MSISAAFIGEINHEAAICRKMLERIPESTWEFKPHEKSMSMKALATHVAEMWTWTKSVMEQPELDFAGKPYEPFLPDTSQQLIEYFDKNIAEAKEALAKTSDATMMEMWSMRNGEQVFFTMPKVAVMRSVILNHVIHHRGQLSVYMRENDIPIPQIYGPSADEPMG
jgi:uncharacterized damage-inducible protein DinB